MNLPKEIIIFFLSMFPLTELRFAIPLAMSKYQMPAIQAFLWAFLGNIVPVVFLVFFLERVSNYLSKRFPFFDRFFSWLFERTRRKNSKKFDVFEELFLIIFVAIPLPVTGGWSGAVAAFVFGIPPKKSIPLIILGLLIAGIIVTLLSMGIILSFK